VWGVGASSVRYIREADDTIAARQIAAAHGFDVDQAEAWAVEVEADEHSLDAHTRHDSATVGFAAFPFDVEG
jgi:hypothetical protein